MAVQLQRKIELIGRSVFVSLTVLSKDTADAALLDKYGDIKVIPSGYFVDPNDQAYPKFYVNAGDPFLFFKNGGVKMVFEDDQLTIQTLLKNASLWANAIQTKVTNDLTSLRGITETTTGSTTVTI